MAFGGLQGEVHSVFVIEPWTIIVIAKLATDDPKKLWCVDHRQTYRDESTVEHCYYRETYEDALVYAERLQTTAMVHSGKWE